MRAAQRKAEAFSGTAEVDFREEEAEHEGEEEGTETSWRALRWAEPCRAEFGQFASAAGSCGGEQFETSGGVGLPFGVCADGAGAEGKRMGAGGDGSADEFAFVEFRGAVPCSWSDAFPCDFALVFRAGARCEEEPGGGGGERFVP